MASKGSKTTASKASKEKAPKEKASKEPKGESKGKAAAAPKKSKAQTEHTGLARITHMENMFKLIMVDAKRQYEDGNAKAGIELRKSLLKLRDEAAVAGKESNAEDKTRKEERKKDRESGATGKGSKTTKGSAKGSAKGSKASKASESATGESSAAAVETRVEETDSSD